MKRTIAGTAAVAVLALAGAGCGDTVDAADLEGQLADQLAPQLNVEPADASVDCPDDQETKEGTEFQCTMTVPNGGEIPVDVTLTDDEGAYDAVIPQQAVE
jgi:hypothetical protein